MTRRAVASDLQTVKPFDPNANLLPGEYAYNQIFLEELFSNHSTNGVSGLHRYPYHRHPVQILQDGDGGARPKPGTGDHLPPVDVIPDVGAKPEPASAASYYQHLLPVDIGTSAGADSESWASDALYPLPEWISTWQTASTAKTTDIRLVGRRF